MAAFIGYMAGGLLGGLAATLGMFLAPTILAASAAGVERLARNRRIQAFGAGAGLAVAGLLGATLWSIAHHAVTSLPLALVAVLSLLLAARTRIQPLWLLMAGAALGWAGSLIRA